MPAGFTTTVFPVMSAGPILLPKQRYGKIPRHDRAAHTDRPLDDHAVPPIVERRNIAAADALAQDRHSVRACARSGESPESLRAVGLPCSCVSRRASSFSRSFNSAQLCTESRRAAAAACGPFLESGHRPRRSHCRCPAWSPAATRSTTSPVAGFRISRRPAVRSVSLFTCNDQFCHELVCRRVMIAPS